MSDLPLRRQQLSEDHHQQGTLGVEVIFLNKTFSKSATCFFFRLSLTYFPRAGGAGHRQHLALLQIEADVLEDGRDVEVGEEEACVAAQVSVGLVLLLDLLKELTNALRRS